MSKYHINPSTGMPGRCRAKSGNCPYGGDESHYKTYSEAFEKSQLDFNSSYKLLPKSLDKIDRETKSILDSLDKDQIELEDNIYKVGKDEVLWDKRQEILNSNDREFILGIIDGSLDEERSWPLIGAALKNKNLPRDIVDKAIYEKLDSHNVLYTRYLMLNPTLTNKDIHHVIKNTNDDETKLLAYLHPSLDKETIMWHIKNKPDEIITFPYHGMIDNHAHRGDKDIMDWRMGLISKRVNYEFPLNDITHSKYNQ